MVNQTLYILHGAAVLSIIFLAVSVALTILILGCLALLEDARLSDSDEWESPKDQTQTPTKLKRPSPSAYKAIGAMIFGLFLVAALTSFAHGQELNGAELAIGPSIRPQSYAVSVRGTGWIAPEIEFVSEGRQPDNIPNINRVLMLNAVLTEPVSPRVSLFAKAGLASSRWSTNGSGNGYSNPGKPGYDIGIGATYHMTPVWGLRLETVYMHYQQSDVPEFENFTQTTVRLVRSIGATPDAKTFAPIFSGVPLSLDVNLASIHTEAWARQQLNQFNPGLGLTYTFSRDWSASAGFYENSYRRTSAYTLANWTPLHASLPGDFTLGAGLTAGLVSGYTRTECPVEPFAAGLLVQIRRKGWGFNIIGVPNTPRGGSGFVGLQLVVPV